MKRFSYKKYLLLAFSLFILITLPTFFVEKSRSSLIALFSPFWKQASKIRGPDKLGEEKKKLESENRQLKIEIAKLKGLLKELGQKTQPLKGVVAASVIYREATSWSSSLWVDVGEKEVKKNSPVLSGHSVVGVVDFVGKKHSRIRLITDSALHPSVRVYRSSSQDVVLGELKKGLFKKGEGVYLAKGILQGAGTPLWRSRGTKLKGIGFNYDFADEKGPSRHLLTGEPIEKNAVLLPPLPLVKVKDVLVTTGMDGVFPPDLCCAIVTKVYPLKEGAYSYDIEAQPTAGNLDELKRVVILPPIEFDKEEA